MTKSEIIDIITYAIKEESDTIRIADSARILGYLEAILVMQGRLNPGDDIEYKNIIVEQRNMFGFKKAVVRKQTYSEHIIEQSKLLLEELQAAEAITVNVAEHSQIDKSFQIKVGHHLYLVVDYDDVNHEAVDAMTEHLKDVIETHWDQKKYISIRKEKEYARWLEDEELREENPVFEDYFNSYLM